MIYTFVIWPHGEQNLQSFHAHLNQMSANIEFTIEKKEEGRRQNWSPVILREGCKCGLYMKWVLVW